MSFISTFEELSKLYESVEPEVKEEETKEEATKEAAAEEPQLKESAEDETPAEEDFVEEPEEATEEEIEVVETKQLILECTNCGGLLIKDEADVTVDEEAGLSNIQDACQYCEEAAGYKIVGVVAPYEATEEEEAAEVEDTVDKATEEDIVEESLLDVNLPIDVDVQANGNDVSVGTLG
jgi:hypothetical protein